MIFSASSSRTNDFVMSPTHNAKTFKPLRAALAVACGAANSISIFKPSFCAMTLEIVPATAILSIFEPLLVPFHIRL